MPGFPVLHYLPEFAQTHVCWVDKAIQPSHPLSFYSPPASIRVFSNESVLCNRWLKYWIFSFSPVLPMNIQDWFPLWWTGLISLQSKGLNKSFLQHHSLKASNFQYSGFFMVRVSHPYMTTGKTIALTIQTFVSESKVIETDLCFFLLVPPLIFITLWGILSYPPFHRWRNRNSEIHLLKVLFPVKKSLN